MKTLQQEYQLIKEGKGNKDHFLKQARHMFPEYITSGNDYTSTIHILKSKNLLSEAIGGIITMKPTKPNWFKIFDTNIREAVGVKNTKEYGDQNEFDTIDKDVQADLDNQFNNSDPKNIDNVYGQSFLMGYYTEMKDPKNADKTVDELKQIVLKNMVKDVTYYNTKASFGVKDIGYTKNVVGGGDPIAPKGKHKSSGYGDMPKVKVVKEGYEGKKNFSEYSNDALKDMIVNLSRYEDTEDEIQIAKDELAKRSIKEVKKPSIGSHLKEIEKTSAIAALESKINATTEAIETRKSKLEISESEDLADMMDKGKIKELKREINQLEKYKTQCEKQLSKVGGKPLIDESTPDEEEMYQDTDPNLSDPIEELNEGNDLLEGVKESEEQSINTKFANVASQSLINLLDRHTPIIAIDKFKHTLKNGLYDINLNPTDIKNIVKFVWDRKGQVNVNTLKQDVRKYILGILENQKINELETIFIKKGINARFEG